MISLDKLRKRSGLVIGIIGLALVAFLLGDLMSSSSSLFNSAQGIIGEVNDEVIDYREFETEAQNIDRIFSGNQDRNGLRDNLWASKVNDVIMGEQYEDLGLAISADELAGLAFGYKSGQMSATAKQIFGLTGQEITPEQLATIIQQIQEQDPQRWIYFENLILQERLSQKYSNLIRKGLMASNIDAEVYYNEQGGQASGRYVFKSFDTNIEVSDSEVTSYYKAHLDDYPQNSSRELTLAIFDITATQADKDAVKASLIELLEDRVVYNKATKSNETAKGFRNTTDARSFVDSYADSSFDPTFYAEGQLSLAIESVLRNAEVGFVYGPYEENNSYKLARLNARSNDSIQVAIIDMSMDASEETANEIYAQASEMVAAKNLESFEAMADEKNIALTTASIQDVDRTVAGLGEARNLVFWAYNDNTALNNIKLDDQNNRIVVAMLSNIVEEGTQDLEEVSFQIEVAVKREKSAKVLTEEFNNYLAKASNIDDLASAMNLVPEQVNTMSFSSNTIPGGFEPNIVGAFYGMEKGQISKPIVGNNGVYVVYADDFIEATATNDYTALKKQLEGQLQSRVAYEVNAALKELSNIEDNRAKFY